MADSAQLEILKQGRDIWNEWRRLHPDVPIDLRDADLRGAKLGAAQHGTGMPATNLSGADLRGADLTGAILCGGDYRMDDVRSCNWGSGLVNGGGLSYADLREVDLRSVNLQNANLQGADLRGANLSGTALSGVNFGDADLRDADLSGLRLGLGRMSGAKLRGTKLSGARLGNTNLSSTDLTETDLSNTDLSFSLLVNANLTGTAVENADISYAHLGNTVFGDLDLRTVTGLETCRHRGPSVVDHRTLMRSGPLPLSFLRGCGLPDRLVDYLPSLLETAVQFYSCFISYAEPDEAFADRLHADLQNNGVRCWFAPHSAEAGKKLHEQIDEAIRVYDKLLLTLSPDSMRSAWVKTEIAKARKREVHQKRRMLFPLSLVGFEPLKEWECFDADTGTDSAKEVREYFIPDFSDWKTHDAYTPAFERLLRDLMPRLSQPVGSSEPSPRA